MKSISSFHFLVLWLLSMTFPVWAGPTIFHVSESAGPGDIVSLQGDSFGSSPQVWMQVVTGTGGSPSPQIQLKVVNGGSGTNVAAQIPTNQTTGLYALWVYDGANYSPYVLVNAARAWGSNDLCGTQIDPSRSFRLFGRNLYLGSGTPTVTFVNGGTTLNATVTSSGSDTNILKVTAPAGLVAGTSYTINVNNGYGGTYGTTSLPYTLTGIATGSDPFGLGVPWGSAFTTIATRTYNVKTGYGAYGDGVHDDSIPIQNAINAAYHAGGGIVYFPAGTYQLSFGHAGNVNDFLTLLPNVVIEGAGATSSTIVLGNSSVLPSYNFGIADSTGSNIGFINIGIHNLNQAGGGTTQGAIGLKSGTNIFLINSQFVTDGGEALLIEYCQNLLIKNTTITNTATTSPDISATLVQESNTDAWFTGNTVSWYFCRGLDFAYSKRTLIENNTLTRNAIDNGTLVESGVINESFTDSTVTYNNTINKGGTGAITQYNDGETILIQSSYAPSTCLGTVTSATSTTLTDSTKDWTNNFGVPEPNISGQLYYLVIVGGPGAGQVRQMSGNTTTTLTITVPWQVIPTSSSSYTIVHMDAMHHLVKNNQISGNPQGIMFYAVSFDDVSVTGNTMVDNGGILLRSDYRPAYSAFQVDLDSQVLNNTISNPSGLYSEGDSDSKIVYEVASNGTTVPVGTNIFGGDVRGNTVIAPVPNAVSGIDGEGCTLKMDGPEQTNTVQGIVGVVFQNNTLENCANAFHLCTGDYTTTIWDNNWSTCTNLLLDVEEGVGGPITHASVGTVFGSLVGDWSFDDEDGTDSSGNGETGTLYDSPSFTTDVPYTTDNSEAITFDGSNRMEIPTTPLLDPNDEITVAFWIKASASGTNYEQPVSKNSPDANPGWNVQLIGTAFFMHVDTSAAYNQNKVGITGLLDDNWHFVTYVINRGTISSYKDGVLQATQTYSHGNGFGGNGLPIEVGSGQAGVYGFLGSLDDVQIYDKALTSTQVSNLYSSF